MADQPGRIVVAGLSKSFGTVRAVDDLSFTVEPGSVTGFLGPNGAGKTTTLRMLLGLVTPDAAAPRPSAACPTTSSRDPMRTVGAVLETPSTPAAPAATTCGSTAAAAGIPDQPGRRGARPGRARRRRPTARPRGYSLGMRQRLGAGDRAARRPAGAACSTSRPTGWTPRASSGCAASCATWPTRAAPCWSPATCSPRCEQTADRVVILERRAGWSARARSRSCAPGAGGRPCWSAARRPHGSADAAAQRRARRSPDGGRTQLHRHGRRRRPRSGTRRSTAGIELHELRTEQRPRGDLLPAHRGQSSTAAGPPGPGTGARPGTGCRRPPPAAPEVPGDRRPARRVAQAADHPGLVLDGRCSRSA